MGFKHLSNVRSDRLQSRSLRDLGLALDKMAQRWAKVRAVNNHISRVIHLASKAGITYGELDFTLAQNTGGEGVAPTGSPLSLNRSTQDRGSLQSVEEGEGKGVPVESFGLQSRGDPEAYTGVSGKGVGVAGEKLEKALKGDPRATCTWTEGGRVVTVGAELGSYTAGERRPTDTETLVGTMAQVVRVEVPMAGLVGKGTPEVVREERNREWPSEGKAKVLGNVQNPKMIAITLEDGRRCSLWKPRNVTNLPKNHFFRVVLDNKANGIYRLL